MYGKIIALIALSFLITTPFGYWRSKTRKYSLAWFLSVHAPVPALYIVRKEMGLSLSYLPIITGFFILGHVFGARLHNRLSPPTSACLFMDALRVILKGKTHGKHIDR